MKIIDVCAFYAPQGGGVKTYIERKLKIGASMGHEIVVIAPGDANAREECVGGGRIIYVDSPKLPVDRRYRYFNDPAAVYQILDAERPDVVESSSPWRAATIVGNWRGCAIRSLVMHADPLAAYAYRWFGKVSSREVIDRSFDMFWRHLRRLGSQFDQVICANETLSARLRGGGVAGVLTVPMGVDPDIFSPRLRDPVVRSNLLARCNLSEEALLLIGVGRHSSEKRWPMVIDACLAASINHPLGLVLIGDGRDRNRIHRYIGGNPHVELLSPIRDRALLASVMASADALIHGCEAETFGLVAAEAAASGLPLIVPDEGGSTDMVTADTGEMYRAADTGAAAQAIVRLIERDQGALRNAAAAHAAKVRTIDAHFEALFNGYGMAVNGVCKAA